MAVAKRTAAPKKANARKAARAPAPPRELSTLLDFVRYAVSRMTEAGVVFAHGTTDPVAEAVFLIGEALHLPLDAFETFATARVTAAEAKRLAALIDARVRTRTPAAYLVNRVYMRGLPFYVDERVIVPRSYLGEILDEHVAAEEGTLVGDAADVMRVLDLCTGSGCLAILSARVFPNADIHAVDLSPDALAVAARNVADYGLEERITLLQGDLFKAVGAARYDIILSNPPYVDAEGMAGLPRECRHEPAMAFDGGPDGIALVRRILDGAGAHLNAGGGLLCEIGRCRDTLEQAYPHLPFLWLDSEDSDGEVFWLPAEALG
jgi:ribosomal protein L3 glutamine methyltransferase